MKCRRPYGFTLVELVVVIALIAVLLTLTLPRFDMAGMFKNRTLGAEDLGQSIQEIRHLALMEDRNFSLHLDMDGARLWFTHSDMNEADLAHSRSHALILPGDLRITHIIFAETFRYGTANTRETGSEQIIRFNRNGHSDGVILHVTERGSPVSLKVAPFLMDIERIEKHVSYDNCP